MSSDLSFDNLPNRITLLRIFLIPFVIGPLFLIHQEIDWAIKNRALLGWIAGWTFALASISDFVDGYIARKRNIQTVFGSFLDPIADKFLVISSLIILQSLGRIPVLVVIILVLREVYMTSLRLLASDQGLSVPVSHSAKWKTTFQMIGIGTLMPDENFLFIPLPLIGILCVYIAGFLSVYSAIIYSWDLIKKLHLKRKGKEV